MGQTFAIGTLKMKKLIFLIPFIAILVVLYLSSDFYSRDTTDKLMELLPAEDQKETNTTSSDQGVKEINKKPVDLKPTDESDTSVHPEGTNMAQEKDEESNVELEDQDAPNEVLTDEHNLQGDPWKETIDAVMEARARGTWIGDPEAMDPDELYSAQYNQFLERFGDIPDVHTYMEYMRNPPMTIDEEIAGLEAMNSLFPSGSTRRTLALLKWMKSNGGYNAFEQGIPIDELRDLGITVEVNETDEGWGYFITTK